MKLSSVLPEEILLEIFSEIEKSDLQRFLEISREWRELLIRNAKVMRKLPLILMKDTWKEKLNFAENYGKYIREVDFAETNIESFDDVMEVLRLTPNVEKLSLVNVKLNEKVVGEENAEVEDPETVEETPIERLNLRKLKQIIIEDQENVGSLKFFETHCDCPLMSLTCDLNETSQLSTVVELLNRSNQLKAFELSTNLDEVFNPSDEVIGGFKFRLESLVIKSILIRYDEQFVKFFKSQKRLREIGLIGEHVDFRYQQMMFTTFPYARHLQLNIDTFATSDVLAKLRKMPPNTSIEGLSLMGENFHLNIFDAVIRLCPKIRQLSIQNLTHFYSDKIHQLSLTHLRVDRLKHEHLRIEKLNKSLRLQLIDIIQSSQPMVTYERNLQSFCDFSLLGDKSKDIVEA